MRKTFNLCALLMLFVFTLTGFSTAKAQTPIEFGKSYSAPAYQYFNGAITIGSPGTLKVQVAGTEGTLYTPSDTEKDWDGQAYLDNGSQEFTYNLTATGTYNYIVPMPWDDSTYVFSFDGQGGNTGGGGGDTGGNVLPVPTTGFKFTQNWYTYTPTENGELTIVFEQAPWSNCLYSTWVTNHAEDPVALNEGIDANNGASTLTWKLTAGHTYYLDASYPGNNVVTTSFKATGGSGTPDPGPGGGDDPDPDQPGGDVPEGWTKVTIGETYNIAAGSDLKLYFSPEKDGKLILNEWGESGNYLHLSPVEDDYTDLVNDVNGYESGSMGNDPATWTYQLNGGETYYFYGVNDSAKYIELSKVEFVSYTTDGGNNPGGGDQPGGDGPEGYEPVQMNQNYTTNGVGAVKLYFTPTTSGKLTITQTGTYDSHLFNAEPVYSAEYGYENNYDKIIQAQNGYENETTATVFPLEYGVAAGVTYYFVAKLSSGDAISNVNFKFEEITSSKEIELNIPYTVTASDGIYTYTADQTGVLSVQWSNPSPTGDPCYNTGIVWGAQQYFFYEDPGLTNPVGMLSGGDGQGGWLVTFGVEEGKTYYFHSPVATRYMVVFTFQDGDVEASLVTINPTPGTAFDVVNYRNYLNVLTSPASSTVENVTLTYVPAGQKDATTIEMSGTPENFGELQVPVADLVRLIEANEIEPNTDVVVTLHGLKAGGNYVTKNDLTNGDEYVTIGENGLVAITYTNGSPVVADEINFPKPWKKAWERGDQQGIGTMIFDGDIYTVGEVSVMQGHQVYGSEGGEQAVYTVVVPNQNIKIEKNVVTIDFTNINFNMPEGTNEVTVMVNGILGTNGLYAMFDGYAVYQYYASYEPTGAEIGDKLISSIIPAPETNVPGFEEGELLEMRLFENVMELNPTAVKAVLLDEDNNQMASIDFEYRPMTGTYIYEFTEDIYLLQGQEYQFVVTVYGDDNAKIGSETIYWFGATDPSTVGVGSLEAENGANVIYTLSGMRVNTTDVNKLSNGLYIINGKKVLIRK